MFELSVSLTRMLEFVAKEVPQAFLHQEINITRLAELLLYVLNRTTTGPDAKIFEQLLALGMAGNWLFELLFSIPCFPFQFITFFFAWNTQFSLYVLLLYSLLLL